MVNFCWSCFKFLLCSSILFVPILTQVVPPDIFIDPNQACSGAYNVFETFNVGNITVSTIYLCYNGYLTIDGGLPEFLTAPGDFFNLQSSTIMTAGMFNSLDFASRRRRHAEQDLNVTTDKV